MLTAGAVSAIVETFIINADDFFPGGMNYIYKFSNGTLIFAHSVCVYLS
jgi:hypothetical protein